MTPCSSCGSKKVKRRNFSSDEFWNEYLDSGMCEKCQVMVFEKLANLGQKKDLISSEMNH